MKKLTDLPSEKRVVEFEMNRPQILARLVNANETWMLVGRGGGKTTGGIAPYMVHNVYAMPRSSGGIIGLSYEHLDGNTMPPLVKALGDLGFYRDKQYVYGKRPPDHWPAPYIPVLDYKQSITFNNGTSIQKVSLARKASSNALSLQWGIFDEVKFMKPDKLYDEIFPIFRGNEQYFQHCSEYLGKFFATDKKADYAQIKWILDKRKLNDYDRINTVITLQTELNRKLIAFETKKTKALREEIKYLRWTLNHLRRDLVYVCEASAMENIHFLGGEKWLKDKLRNSKNTYDFEITYLNKDPDAAEELFYPDFKESYHGYESDHDIEPNEPFIIAADYQHSIAPINVTQINDRVMDRKSLNWTDEVYTLAPKGLSDAVTKFCTRHASHRRKLVYYVYDQTAIGKRVDAEPYNVIVVKALRACGWKVIEVYMGDTPDHGVKWQDIKSFLNEKEEGALPIRINKRRCPKTIISIKNAPAVIKNNKTQKDKLAEKNKDLDQSETTHFSDVFDQIVWAVLKLKLVRSSTRRRGGAAIR